MRGTGFFAGVGFCALAFHAATAFAQTPAGAASESEQPAADDAAAIVVTGSSIRGVAAVASQSVALDRDDILKSGLGTSTEIIRTLPQVVNVGADESRRVGSQDAAANRTRTSGINLRGLSSEATLLLLNGRRLAPNGTIKALADPSMIPSIAIQRLEIVPDGASAIYGADAVAGVVNMITRKPFDGLEVTGRYSVGEDVHGYQGGLLASKTWQGGGVLAAYEYNFRSNLAAADRPYLTADLRSIGGTDQRSNLAAPGNIVVGTTRYPLPNGTGRGLTAAQLAAGAPNKYDTGLVGDILPKQRRHSAYLTAFQNLGERFTLSYEGFYSNRHFYENVVPASSTLTVPRTNPFFVHPTNPAATSVSVEYRFLDANGDANWSGYDIGWQNALNLRFDAGSRWQVNAYGAISKNKGRARTEDLTNLIFLPLALADTNPATAFNPFGNGVVANNNAETLRKIEGLRDSFTTNKSRDIGIKADGPIFAIGGGDVRLAVGAEYHENELRYIILSSLKNAANDLIPDRDRSKGRNNKAVFAELNIPLFSNANAVPGFRGLNIQAAARYEKYSDFGETFNPKFGVTWTPFDMLRLRGSWGTSFRAPSLIDSSDAIFNIFIQTLTDNGVQKRGIFMNGGNNNLKPEKAETWSVGGDFKPDFIPGFSISATYYNIKYKNVIDALAAATILGNTALYGQYANRTPTIAQIEALLASPNLESVKEPASSLLLIVDGRRYNIGRFNQDGLDLEVNQRIETVAAGTFNFGIYYTRVFNSERSSAPGVPFQETVNLINFPARNRIRGNAGWQLGGLSANIFWNHIGRYRNNTIAPVQIVKSYDTFDASLGYELGDGAGMLKGLRLSVSGQNIFNRRPPTVINGGSGIDTQNASPLGRYISFDIRKSF